MNHLSISEAIRKLKFKNGDAKVKVLIGNWLKQAPRRVARSKMEGDGQAGSAPYLDRETTDGDPADP